MQRRPGGGVLTLVGPEQPATPPSAGVACSDQPGLLCGLGRCSWAYQRARRDAAMPGGALGRWGAEALGR